MVTTQLQITPLHEIFVAQIEGIDLSKPLDPNQRDQIIQALHQYGVLVFREQTLPPEAQITFSRQFGELYVNPKAELYPQLTQFGDVGFHVDGFAPPDNEIHHQEWHADHSHRPTQAAGSILYARIVPEVGGETWFSCTRHALATLPRDLRQEVEHLKAVHTGASLMGFRERTEAEVSGSRPTTVTIDGNKQELITEDKPQIPEIIHPLIKTHPKTQVTSLYFGSHIVDRILDLSDSENRAVMDALTEHIARPEVIYRHRWQVGDAVFWDNRLVVHTGTHYDRSHYSRLMQRTTILDTPAVLI